MTQMSENYYFRTARDRIVFPPLEGDVEADVCVIGGGLAGLAVALGLAERGRRAVVLEAQCVGYGASGRNGGFVLAGFAADPHSITRKTGLTETREMFALTRKAQKLIKKRIADYNIDCQPVDGHLRASWYNDPDDMKRSVDYMNDTFDIGVEFWPQEKVRDVCRTGRYYEGQFFPDYFHIHPLNYMTGLARTLVDKGGRIFEYTPAIGLSEMQSGLVVKTAHGAVRANDVVFCGSAYFNGIERKLQSACLPVSTYVMVTDPVDPAILRTAIARPYAIRDTRWSDDYYRILPDSRILWGGRVGLGRKAPRNLPDLMLGDLLKIYPQLCGHVRADTAWAGVMGYTVHKMPHIGRLRPGVWACTNFGGNGVGPTTAGGEVIAAAIAQGDETYKLFEPFGYQWTGGALGPLVAQVVYHSWEIRDRFYEAGLALKQKRIAV